MQTTTRDDPARVAPPTDWPEGEETAYFAALSITKAQFKSEAITAIEAVLDGRATSVQVFFADRLQDFDQFDLGEVLGDITHTQQALLLAATFSDDARIEARKLSTKLIGDLADKTAQHLAEKELA